MSPKAARREELFVREVDGDVVVFDKQRQEAHHLNRTVARLWSELFGERSTAEIEAALNRDESLVALSFEDVSTTAVREAGSALSVSRREAVRTVPPIAAVG